MHMWIAPIIWQRKDAFDKIKDKITPEINDKVDSTLNDWFGTAPQVA